MDDRSAHLALCTFDVNMEPLVVPSGFREHVDLLLVNRVPGRDPQFLAGKTGDFIQADKTWHDFTSPHARMSQ